MTTDARAAMQQLEQKFVDWAERRPDIRAAVVVGSWARVHDHPADEWSDLDIGFLTTRSRHYLTTTAWLREIENVWLAYPDRLGPNLHVLFEGAVKVDILPLPVRTMKLAMRIIPPLMRHETLLRLLPKGARRELDFLRDFYRRGIRISLDKDAFAAGSSTFSPRHFRIPASAMRDLPNVSFWTLSANSGLARSRPPSI